MCTFLGFLHGFWGSDSASSACGTSTPLTVPQLCVSGSSIVVLSTHVCSRILLQRVASYFESATIDQLLCPLWDVVTDFVRVPGAPEPFLTSLCISPGSQHGAISQHGLGRTRAVCIVTQRQGPYAVPMVVELSTEDG